jgi:hypothetical protein
MEDVGQRMSVCRTGTCHVRRSAPAARHIARRGLSQVHGLHLLKTRAQGGSLCLLVQKHMAPRSGKS